MHLEPAKELIVASLLVGWAPSLEASGRGLWAAVARLGGQAAAARLGGGRRGGSLGRRRRDLGAGDGEAAARPRARDDQAGGRERTNEEGSERVEDEGSNRMDGGLFNEWDLVSKYVELLVTNMYSSSVTRTECRFKHVLTFSCTLTLA